MLVLSKAGDLVQGGQLYWAFPFSKGSLPKPIMSAKMLTFHAKTGTLKQNKNIS